MVSPLALFSDQCLKDLLTTEDDMTLLTMVQEALTYLNSVLRTTFDTSHGRGSFEQSWRAYQTHIALEELIYGHPLSPHDHQLTIVLGTSATVPKASPRCGGSWDWHPGTLPCQKSAALLFPTGPRTSAIISASSGSFHYVNPWEQQIPSLASNYGWC
ncbi:hypothetical protein ABVT39_010070 [Epinephelus coioides]